MHTPQKISAFLLAVSLLSPIHSLSAADANGYRKYRNGEYDAAVNAYEQQLETSRFLPKDALHYGAAASAYKLGDFQKSIQSFGRALLSHKPAVQEKAHYGLGNALYREGETRLENPQDTLVQWHNAVDHYEAALALNPQHEDARFNLDLVKKRIKELEQQQQQQQQGEQEKDQQDQQQSGQQQDQKQDSSGNEDQDQENQDPQQPNQKQDQPQNGDNQEEPDDQKEAPQGQLGADDHRPQHPQPAEERDQPNPDTGFTPSQARQLLRSLADEDLNVRPLVPPSRDPVFKDW